MIVHFTIGAASPWPFPKGRGEKRKVGESNPIQPDHGRLLSKQLPQPIRIPSVLLQWSHRELNPDLQPAALASSRWTMAPFLQMGPSTAWRHPPLSDRPNKKSPMSLRHQALAISRGIGGLVSQAQGMAGQRTGRMLGQAPDPSPSALVTRPQRNHRFSSLIWGPARPGSRPLQDSQLLQ